MNLVYKHGQRYGLIPRDESANPMNWVRQKTTSSYIPVIMNPRQAFAAIKAGVIREGERVRFGFHNFRHSLASSLVKLKCDPKTVQGILRHEDVRTTMQLYAQSDQESKLEAQGKFLELLLGDKTHLLTERIQ